MLTPEDVLYKYWKYSDFRGLQKEVIHAALAQKDTCVFFPTGGGKSLCFQVPALIMEGLCIVVSPLISLIQDQVKTLNDKGIKAIHLKSGLSYRETDRIFDNVRYGKIKFLYLSPEKLKQPVLLERLKFVNINLVAIDEAHCISQWGHDFRPAFLEISNLREFLPNVPFMALTATATNRVQIDIQKQLKLKNVEIFKTSFKRTNIALKVIHTDDKWHNLISKVKSSKRSGIVYVRSRKATLDIAKLLNQNNVKTSAFHGGLLNNERQIVLEKWLSNEVKIVVATTAFGMGIDKADVDLIFHINLPESLESYYQEIGRAGRNGEESQAILVYNNTDVKRLKFQFLNNLPDRDSLKAIYKKLMSFLQIAYGEGVGQEHGLNFYKFCKRYKLEAKRTFENLKLLDRLSIITLDQQYQINIKLQIVMPHQNLLNFLRENKKYSNTMTFILRTYAGVFELLTKIDLLYLTKKLRITQETLIKQLKSLKELEVIELKLMEQDMSIQVLLPREDDRTINMNHFFIDDYRQQKINQIKTVINFVNNKDECLQQQLLNYFDEESNLLCGKCSYCILNNSEIRRTITPQDLLAFIKDESKSLKEISSNFNTSSTEVILMIESLLENKKIKLTPNNLYEIN